MINSSDTEQHVCNWRKTDIMAGQEVYETDCGAVTSAIIGVLDSYTWCPFCSSPIKFWR